MDKNIYNIVNYGDHICASLDCNGRRLASVNGYDFTSVDAVKQALLDIAGCFAGMAVLTIRNCTLGWRDVTALATTRKAVAATRPLVGAMPHVGAQYLIPWAS